MFYAPDFAALGKFQADKVATEQIKGTEDGAGETGDSHLCFLWPDFKITFFFKGSH